MRCAFPPYAPNLPREFVADRAFDRDRLLDRGAGHHALVMRHHSGIVARRRVQRVDKAPEQAEEVDVGERILAADRPGRAAEALFTKVEHLAPALIAGTAR